MFGRAIRCLFIAALALAVPARAETSETASAIAMHGEPALAPGFDHFPYVNPDAPKGGRLNLAFLGAFDSLNPYNVKALSTAQGLTGNVYQSLMMRSDDEPFTLYGLIAEIVGDRCGARPDRVPPQSVRPIFRRVADHIG